MTINFYKYLFPFNRPFVNAQNSYKYRQGMLFHLHKKGISAWGEASPLPGFSGESLQDVQTQITDIKTETVKLFSSHFSMGDVNSFCTNYKVLPSLQFALFTACCFYLAQVEQKSVQSLLFGDNVHNIAVNGVIDLNQPKPDKQAAKLVASGFKTIKLKAGNSPEFLAVLKHIRHKHPELTIRLDANQSWSPQQAVAFLHKVEPLKIEYCEEPLRRPTPANLKELKLQTNIHIALDESLINTFHLQEARQIAPILIIKPMISGIAENYNLLKTIASAQACKLIFTSSLESGIGRLMTAILAAGLGTKNKAHGIATGHLLKSNMLADSDFIKEGNYHLPSANELPELMNINPQNLPLQKINV